MKIQLGTIEVRPDGYRAFCPTGEGGGVDNSCGREGGPSSDLSDDELRAISMWTSENDTYKKIRDCQNSNIGCNEEIRKTIDLLNSALDKMPPYEGQVERGLKFESEEDRAEFVARAMRGEIGDKGFMSTSTQKHRGEMYSGVGRKAIGVALLIKSKTGRAISKYSELPNEMEVLFKPGTRFKFVKMSKGRVLNKIKMHLEEI